MRAPVLLTVCALATISDLRARRIPLALNAIGIWAGVVAWGVERGPLWMLYGLAGVVIGFAVPLVFERRIGEIGGGDVVLCAACGAIVGPVAVLPLLLLAWLVFLAYARDRVQAPAAPAILVAAMLVVHFLG